ncbi:unnamed protein product [Acanthoscelides obtectus]|uniref:Uncharacterized protein n=1 Tax=Acanthoscelides obtectus TaxID=200917 RepID=A0A9P0JJ93_ACAOB|nr:unnamed protein product [Acanthoscelides obtectus]CAK1624929.1 hypothetical protein AOBTE_LOCUS2856 [Acanthoscelides obtectus]
MKLLIILTIATVSLIEESSAAKKTAQKYAPPVAILKQIDKHNEDGSYTYGYEAEDGSFKIETKYPDGEVYGKYGYIDDTGALREVEYGASRRGFEPAGNEIQVAPPTLRSNKNAVLKPLAPDEEDDGQYREDPAIYYQNEPSAQPQQKHYQQPAPRYQQPVTRYQPRPVAAIQREEPAADFEIEAFKPSYRPQARTQPIYRPATSYTRPRPSLRPQTTYVVEPEYEQEPEPEYERPQPKYRPSYSLPSYQNNNYNPPPPAPAPTPVYRPQSNFGFSNTQPTYNNPAPYSPNPYTHSGAIWNGNPAQNVDLWTGSYSVNYKR